ncbi:hypothetical protein [Embleya sp. NBC_00896]|uniref:hypothetical protein n=1 Tax=Embleya sp. NBC_00896 TaxID=2975961 RepID=UPI002F90E642|nr:hypothetical protein OG928_46930 [Embleya sp. NBC_00896]
MPFHTAPEIARRLIDTPPDANVDLDDAAAIYSLGRRVPLGLDRPQPGDHPRNGSGRRRPDIMEDIASGRHRVPLARARPWPAPELEDLVENATTHLATRRRRPVPAR